MRQETESRKKRVILMKNGMNSQTNGMIVKIQIIRI